ncbi:MAG: DUF2939 domain-containing protein [Sphingomonas sp.]|uniref:DUF2939 domain-containing protein n=1 Tax=Sphingomonas sp. TaxID=28214 RepID=UPI001215C43C|nr:DUF2939 domain-containing protein [Sphingomonas sp.]THD35416.1 MAG: DUF2939 domain-containing protein [Sphingomonas sp.]
MALRTAQGIATMKGWVPASVAAVAFGLGCFWYVGSPWVTLYGLRTAIEKHDVEGIIGYVDFAALRQNLKAQVGAGRTAPTPRTDANGWSLPTRDTSRLAAIDEQIDTYITPETVRLVLARAGPPEDGRSFTGAVNPAGELVRDVALDRTGLGTFVVHARNSPGGVGFVFSAHGLSWRLSGIDVPASMTQSIGKRITAW